VLFLEPSARALLIVHLIGGALAVGATTHQLLWCRGYLRGDFARRRSERRLAWIAAIAFAGNFAFGSLLYPTYKVRVRAQYLDSPSAVANERELRRAEAERQNAPIPPPALGGELSWVGRLFDVKEHWAALGLVASLLLLALSRFAHPADHRASLALYLGLAAFACASAWGAAIIGALTASFRSTGGAT